LQEKLKKIPYEEAKTKYKAEQKAEKERAKLKKKIMLDRAIVMDPDNLYFE
jgi:hypothetical protein